MAKNKALFDALKPDEPFVTEEVENGAVFSVKFRKRQNLMLKPGDTSVEITKSFSLSAAPLERLITELIINQESNFVNVFFSTYRTFTTVEYVVDEMHRQLEEYPLEAFAADKYMSPDDLHMRTSQDSGTMDIASESESGWRARNVATVAKIWVKKFPEDFAGNTELCDKLKRVVEAAVRNTFHEELDLMDMIDSLKVTSRKCRPLNFSLSSGLHDEFNRTNSRSPTTEKSGWSDEDSGNSSNNDNRKSEASLVITEAELVMSSSPDTGDEDTSSPSYTVCECTPYDMAVELTRIDSELFLAVRPYECLAATWSKRGREVEGGGRVASSVMDTVEQFNRVCRLVMTSCVHPPNFLSYLPDNFLASIDPADEEMFRRAAVVSFWVKTAQECRNLRNYSSLRAILSALGSSSISRLRLTWDSVDKHTLSMFSELSALTSADGNEFRSRELLTKEGTAKDVVSQPSGREDHRKIKRLMRHTSRESNTPPPSDMFCPTSPNEESSLSKKQSLKGKSGYSTTIPRAISLPPLPLSRSNSDHSLDKLGTPRCAMSLERSPSETLPTTSKLSSTGVVPYLGIFLTDLTMIDSAHSDTTTANNVELQGKKLLNFTKRRKEFEVLAQINLFQKQARAYKYCSDPLAAVAHWINHSDVVDEQKCYEESTKLEGAAPAARRPSACSEHQNSTGIIKSLRRCMSRDLNGIPPPADTPVEGRRPLKTSLSLSACSSHAVSSSNTDEHVVRVALHPSLGQTNMRYHTMLITNGTKTNQFLEKMLHKVGLKLKPVNLQLYQVLSEKEFMSIRGDVNLFYAIKTEVLALSFFVNDKNAKPPTKLSSDLRKNGFWPRVKRA